MSRGWPERARTRPAPPPRWRRALPVVAAQLLLALPAPAQISYDGSIGAVSPGQTPIFSGNTYFILQSEGAFSGGNLFYSFDEFSVPASTTARFLELPTAPERIISRVTGGNISEIYGTVRASAGDLFLLNSAGIIVGPGGAFQTTGDVFLSTADGLTFEDDEFFPSTLNTPTLTNAAPESFGFLTPLPMPIRIHEAELNVAPRFTVVAGDVEIVGAGGDPATLRADSGQIQLAAVRGNPDDRVEVPLDLAGFDVSGFAPGALGEIRIGFSDDPLVMDQAARITVDSSAGAGTGGVVIRGGQLVMRGGSIEASARNDEDPVPAGVDAIDAKLSERVTLEQGAALVSRGDSDDGASGAIRVAAPLIELRDPGTRIESKTENNADGADVFVDAGEQLLVENRAQIFSQTTNIGEGGDLHVQAGDQVAVLSRGAILSEAVDGATGGGGDVTVTVDDPGGRILVESEDADTGVSQIAALTDSPGPGGKLTLTAPVVEAREGGQLRTTTLGPAPGGLLTVNAGERLTLDGRVVLTSSPIPVASGVFALSRGPGSSGNIVINTPVLEVLNGATLGASAQSTGGAGQILIRNGAERSQLVLVQGGADGLGELGDQPAPSLVATDTSSGPAGGITIDTDRLELIDGGQVSSSTFGITDAGIVRVNAGTVLMSGTLPPADDPSGIFAVSGLGGPNAGDGGDIVIVADDEVSIQDGATVAASSIEGGGDGQGDAGDIIIDAGRRLLVARGSITTEANSNAAGGKVFIQASELIYLADADIITQVGQGQGGGGDVNMPIPEPGVGDDPLPAGVEPGPPPEIIVVNRSNIIANADFGPGGNITLAAGQFLASDESVIEASSQRGIDGTIVVDAPSSDLVGQITPLPTNYIDASQLLNTPCAARRERTGSFVIHSRATLEPAPDAPLTAPSEAGAADAGDCPL